MSRQASLLKRFSIALPVTVIAPSKTKRASYLGAPGKKLTETFQNVEEPASSSNTSMFGFASIYENDVFTFPEKTPLEFNFTSADSSFISTIPLPIRLPSLGLVDSNIAEDFANELISYFSLEFHSDSGTYSVKFTDPTC